MACTIDLSSMECAKVLFSLSGLRSSWDGESCAPDKASISWILNEGTMPPPSELECPAAKAQAAFTGWSPTVDLASAAKTGLVTGFRHASGSHHAVPDCFRVAMGRNKPAVGTERATRDPASCKRSFEGTFLISSASSSEVDEAHTATAGHVYNVSSDCSASSSPCASQHEGSEDGDRKAQTTIALDTATAADIYHKRPRDAGTKYGSMACAGDLCPSFLPSVCP